MGDSMIINQTDGLEMNNNNNSTNKPLEATVVRSREPSVARSYAEPQREKSVSRTITIVQSSAQKVGIKYGVLVCRCAVLVRFIVL